MAANVGKQVTASDLFMTIFAAVACGNLLFAIIIWGFVQYSRSERDGEAGTKRAAAPLLSIIIPLVFLALLTAELLGKTPSWLALALQ